MPEILNLACTSQSLGDILKAPKPRSHLIPIKLEYLEWDLGVSKFKLSQWFQCASKVENNCWTPSGRSKTLAGELLDPNCWTLV